MAPMIAAASRANDIGIEIEAALAFGTGHHGTTLGCLRALVAICKRRRPQHVLDVGTGTGVLAIAAARLLRMPVACGDADAVAVEVARAQCARQWRRRAGAPRGRARRAARAIVAGGL